MSTFWMWLNGPPQHRRGVAALRVLCGLYLIVFAVSAWPDAAALWGPHGIAVSASPWSWVTRGAVALGHVVFGSPIGTYALLGAMIAAGLALVVDVAVWPATLVGYLAMILLIVRFPMFTEGDYIASRLAFGFLLLTTPRPVRAGSWRAFLHNLGVALLVSQVMIAYWTAGFMKAGGATWWHGTALGMIGHVGMFTTPAFRWATASAVVASVVTYAVLWYELWFPVAMLSPLRGVWIVAGLVLEATIGVTMHLVRFAIIMTGLLLFVPSNREYEGAWDAIRRAAQAVAGWAWPPQRTPTVAVYLDTACTVCSATGRAVSAIDVRRAIQIRSLYDDPLPAGISDDDAARAMVTVDLSTGRVAQGFAAVRTIVAHTTVLRPLGPVLWLLERIGLGNRVYGLIAAHRYAAGEACPIERRASPSPAWPRSDGGKPRPVER